MSRRARPHYRPGLGWILGVAFVDTLTRPVRLAQGFTFVRCCGAPRASSPHGLAAPGPASHDGISLRAVASGSRLLPTRPAKDFHLQSSAHARHTYALPQAPEPESSLILIVADSHVDCRAAPWRWNASGSARSVKHSLTWRGLPSRSVYQSHRPSWSIRVCRTCSRRPRSGWNGWIISKSNVPLEPKLGAVSDSLLPVHAWVLS